MFLRIVHDNDAGRPAKDFTGFRRVHFVLKLDMNGFTMTDHDGHADARGLNREVGDIHDLAGFIDHLQFLAEVTPFAPSPDFGDEVLDDRMRIDRDFGVLPGRNGRCLVAKFVDRTPASAAHSLIGIHDYPTDRIASVKWPKCDHHLGSRTIWSRDDPEVFARCVWVDFRHDKRDVGMHSPRI